MPQAPFRARLKFYNRDHRQTPCQQSPLVGLMPRSVWKGHKAVQDAHDMQVRLNDAVLHHRAESARAEAEADVAAAAYTAAVSEALASGGDSAAVQNDEPRLRATAKHHAALADSALRDATIHGHGFGELQAAAAAQCFGPSEQELAKAADAVRGSVSALRESWSRWAEAWRIRQRLSSIAVAGGTQFGFETDRRVPAEVEKALTTVEDYLKQLDDLTFAESEIAEFRRVAADARTRSERLSQGHSEQIAPAGVQVDPVARVVHQEA